MTVPSHEQLSLAPEAASSLLRFMHISEKLKEELRHSFTSGGRRESVAEHSWRVSLLALLMRPYLPKTLDWERLSDMLIIHDLAEARTGDVPIFETEREDKTRAERAAIADFRDLLPESVGVKIQQLWEEFEARETLESRIANALDKLEAQIQHNEAALDTWVEWERQRVHSGLREVGLCHPSISSLTESIVREATEKIAAGE
jgi:putative hydrolases of HD superfamily